MRAGLARTLVIVTTGAIAWPRRMAAIAATISTLPPPAASVLIAQLTKPAANSARSVRLGAMGQYRHLGVDRALISVNRCRLAQSPNLPAS